MDAKNRLSLPPGTIIAGRYCINELIAGSSYSHVYKALDTKSSGGFLCCVKIERPLAEKKHSLLRHECNVILKLAETKLVPRVLAFTPSEQNVGGAALLALELLGEDLRKPLKRRRQLSPQTTAFLGLQMLKVLQRFHQCGYIHNDVKPANFVLGRSSNDRLKVHAVDFGLARKHIGSNGVPKPPKETCNFRGTTMYASLAAHDLEDLGRKDDLWSMLFSMIEFVAGQLPWGSVLRGNDQMDRHQKKLAKKKVYDLKKRFVRVALGHKEKNKEEKSLFRSLAKYIDRRVPKPLVDFLKYLSTLKYESEPDYAALRVLLSSIGSPDELLSAAQSEILGESSHRITGEKPLIDVSCESNLDETKEKQRERTMGKSKEMSVQQPKQMSSKRADASLMDAPLLAALQAPLEEVLEALPPAKDLAEAARCQNCGAELRLGDKFCRNCGAEVTSETNQSNKELASKPKLDEELVACKEEEFVECKEDPYMEAAEAAWYSKACDVTPSIADAPQKEHLSRSCSDSFEFVSDDDDDGLSFTEGGAEGAGAGDDDELSFISQRDSEWPSFDDEPPPKQGDDNHQNSLSQEPAGLTRIGSLWMPTIALQEQPKTPSDCEGESDEQWASLLGLDKKRKLVSEERMKTHLGSGRMKTRLCVDFVNSGGDHNACRHFAKYSWCAYAHGEDELNKSAQAASSSVTPQVSAILESTHMTKGIGKEKGKFDYGAGFAKSGKGKLIGGAKAGDGDVFGKSGKGKTASMSVAEKIRQLKGGAKARDGDIFGKSGQGKLKGGAKGGEEQTASMSAEMIESSLKRLKMLTKT